MQGNFCSSFPKSTICTDFQKVPGYIEPGTGIQVYSLHDRPLVDTVSIVALASNEFKPDNTRWRTIGQGLWVIKKEMQPGFVTRPFYVNKSKTKTMRLVGLQFEVGKVLLGKSSYSHKEFSFKKLSEKLIPEMVQLGFPMEDFLRNWWVTRVDFFRDFTTDLYSAKTLTQFLSRQPVTNERLRTVTDEEVYKAITPWFVRVFGDGSGHCLYYDNKCKDSILRSEVRFRKSSKVSRLISKLYPDEDTKTIKMFPIFMNRSDLWDYGYNVGLDRVNVPRGIPVIAGNTDRARKRIDRHYRIGLIKKAELRRLIRHGVGTTDMPRARELVRCLKQTYGWLPAAGINQGPDLRFDFLYTD